METLKEGTWYIKGCEELEEYIDKNDVNFQGDFSTHGYYIENGEWDCNIIEHIQHRTELTYSQFLDMMGESEEKSKVIENSEKELVNNDGMLYIGEGLENYYKDQLERTGKFKVVAIEDYNKLQILLNHKPNPDYQSDPFPGQLG